MNIKKTVIALMLTSAFSGLAQAGVSADEAKQLGATLTAIGAEKGANKDGSIPAYTGGNTALPAGFKEGAGLRPDPFANEKPVLVIDGKNMASHAARLTEGAKALLTKYPSYRLDVYPTHRSVAFPKFVTDNTAKCAVTAKTTNAGRSMGGCRAGIPFPIPKDGYEAMWNHLLRFNGVAYEVNYSTWNVDASGRVAMSAKGTIVQEYPYWNMASNETDIYWKQRINYTGPARRAGEAFLWLDPLDFAKKERRVWQYLPGQRRVRVAPDLAFDTPNPGTSGASTFDEVFIFNGSMDRFDFKLVGKKELYIPYNDYRMAYHSTSAELAKPNHLNPDLVRWELHRVWVVEATLREGKRHVYSKRVFYLDEDSWAAVASDQYDARGQLFRCGFAYATPSYEVPAPWSDMHGIYDLISGSYSLTGFIAETGGMHYTKPLPVSEWTGDSLAGGGLR